MGASTTRWLAGLLVASIISLVLLVGRMGAPMFDAGHVASAVGWPERAAFPEMDMEQPGASQQPTRASMTLLQWLAHTDPVPPRSASDTDVFPGGLAAAAPSGTAQAAANTDMSVGGAGVGLMLGKAASSVVAAFPVLPATSDGARPRAATGLATQPGASGGGGGGAGGSGPSHTSMTLLQWLAHTDPFPPRPASETAASPRLQRQFATAIHNGGISIGTSVAPPPSVKQQAKPISGKKMLFDPSSTLVRYTDRGDCGPRGDDAQADLTQCALGYTTVEEVPNQNYETRASVNGCDFFGWTVYACRA